MSYTPTEAVASAARRGLRLREKVTAGTPVGIARARDLSNRRPVSLETIGRMVSFFARHGAQKPASVGTDAEPTPWLVAWLLWGGDAGREWAERIWERDGRQRRSAQWAPVAWAAEPAGVDNPKGLHVGRAFRTLTADEAVRDGRTGDELGRLTVEDLRQMVAVFDARRARGEGAPRIDYNHGPSSGGRPEVYGEVLALYVDGDERGPGLYVVPGWTDYGRDFVAQHATPTGDSLLSNSPEFAIGPAFSRGGDGEHLGDAELYGVALTPTPQQAERIIDTVRLSTTAALAGAGGGGSMDPEQLPPQDLRDMLSALIAEALAPVLARLDAIEAHEREAEEPAPVVDMAADVAGLSPEALSEQLAAAAAALAAAADEEERKAMSVRLSALGRALPAVQQAWAARRTEAEVGALKAELARVEAARMAERCDADVARLVERGLPESRRAEAVAAWSLAHDPAHAGARKLFAATRSPWQAMCDEVSASKAFATVPQGRAGVRGDAAPVSQRDVIQAWATKNGIDYSRDPGAAARAFYAQGGIQ
jgi:hypothetical protein